MSKVFNDNNNNNITVWYRLVLPCYPAHRVDAFRATQKELNDAVTKCNMLHFWCDMWPFCEPDHIRKIDVHTAEGGLECSS